MNNAQLLARMVLDFDLDNGGHFLPDTMLKLARELLQFAPVPSALDDQVGGDHYRSCKIQPVRYIEANELLFLEGCVVKRITRHDKPTGKGRQDIEKAIHELQLLLELRYNE